MEGFKGIFGRNTPQDWLEKLRKDYRRICADPADRDAAVDFFQTSELLVDWLYPNDRAAREQLRNSKPLLQVCSYLANQTKHYEAKAKHHTSVSSAEVEWPAFDPRVFQKSAFQVGGLPIKLKGDAARDLGASIKAEELARRLLKFWEAYSFP